MSILLGDCRNENLIESIFGSISEFARLVEVRGNDFVFGKIQIKYNRNKDIHSFYAIR